MSYVVLARKYRPQTFDEIYAQDHVTTIIKNAISSNRIAHAYLFNGPRGVGKTSMARILAKSLNCETGPTTTPCNVCSNCVEITLGVSTDVIEIDGASNTGVDDIRDLQRELMYAPTQSKFKIYIIDEVHMLSKNAFNALLKTLEEPPENVIFIFATTEPHKVLPTIISRCQRYDFKRIPVEAIVRRLQEITHAEGIKVDKDSLYLIARKADGGLRDALSLMDQVLSYCSNEVDVNLVRNIFGILPNQVYRNLLQAIHDHSGAAIIMELHNIMEQGTDLQELLNSFLDFARVLILCKLDVATDEINPDEQPLYTDTAKLFNINELMYIISCMIQTKQDIKYSTNPSLIMEVALLKLTKMDDMDDISHILHLLQTQGFSQVVHTPAPRKEVPPAPPVKAPVKVDPKPVMPPEPKEENTTRDIDLALIQENWQKIIALVKKTSNASGISLSTAKPIAASNTKLDLTTDMTTSYNLIKANIDSVSQTVSEFFNKSIRVDITLLNSDKPVQFGKKYPNQEDIDSEYPDIAELMSITNSSLLP
ncbi:MAG: DNA polymerase III subunit gamma/tau [Candidatus Cloacimonetes bacterium HGW-Cloacimonetes-1]|nr:MAG: DNA polymerase III subunit gamma/tau [Candidatus Cloacimonetes bacterium HGW-Cloacimonetes-1]